MTTEHLLDPELLPLIEAMPPGRFTPESLPDLRRARAAEAMAAMTDPGDHGVFRQEVAIDTPDGQTRALVYTPLAATEARRGAYLHLHGGGYIAGSPEMADLLNVRLSGLLGIVVGSIEYRLAPEHPVPAALVDAYAGLRWLHEEADVLHVDRARIAIGGESAGGGLAAALAIEARDRGEYPVCHQHLTYPMIDDRTGTEDAPGDLRVGEFVWTRDNNRFGWSSYLGSAPAAAPHVPARVADVAGLPPTWICTAGLDLFRDENIAYAERLMAAGVSTELVVVPRACHGFQVLPGTSLEARYRDDHQRALGAALAP